MRKRPRSMNLKEASTDGDESEGASDSGMDEIVGKPASASGRSRGRPKGSKNKGKGKATAAAADGEEDDRGTSSFATGRSRSTPSVANGIPRSAEAPRGRKTSGYGFLSALSYSLHGMMDVDPETARRNTITKTRESISQVSEVVWAGNEIAANERWVAGGRAAPVGARPEVLKLDDPS